MSLDLIHHSAGRTLFNSHHVSAIDANVTVETALNGIDNAIEITAHRQLSDGLKLQEAVSIHFDNLSQVEFLINQLRDAVAERRLELGGNRTEPAAEPAAEREPLTQEQLKKMDAWLKDI